ncbi:tRNA dimethylallyltransferase 2-like protein, partial [Drosera capensis]
MSAASGPRNPRNGVESSKPKIIVIMGPTGSGKSKLAIDLASQFPIEIISADSMQVYKGLDVLTNKVTIDEQKGVPHHLLGTVDSSVEFTSKDFRDSASMLIDEILSHNHLPVIVGGTNFYIQALVSPFLLDDAMEDDDSGCLSEHPVVGEPLPEVEVGNDDGHYSYEQLKILDPIAAHRIHPNDKRKVQHYVDLIVHGGVLPSELFRGKMVENWGRIDNSRYNCCFICVDASLSVLDEYVGKRVDKMIDDGLLDEVFDIYSHNADYTRGLRQAIGVREFENFLNAYLLEAEAGEKNPSLSCLTNTSPASLKENMRGVLSLSVKSTLDEAIDKMKANTRRLARRQ